MLIDHNTLGTIFAIYVLTKRLKIDDALVGALTNGSKLLSGIVYAFAAREWHMLLGPIAEFIGEAAPIAMRSLASKLVAKQEVGKINSMFGIAESLAPLIYTPILAAVYTETLTTMPGAFFLVGGVMTVPGILLFL